MKGMNGFLLIDKPVGLSSFAVVAQVRKLLRVRKAGHCGTLDPLATGLLIVCLGRATKLSRFVLGNRKSYFATVTLGGTTDTYDREGSVLRNESGIIPAKDEIELALHKFRGHILQTPPIFSALKLKGKPLYKYARNEEQVKIEPREAYIESITLTAYSYPTLQLSITCGAGTYIRSLAHDLGQVLGCGGYIEELRRDRIGEISVRRAITPKQLEDIAAVSEDASKLRAELGNAFVDISEMIDLPAIIVDPASHSHIAHGRPLRMGDIRDFGSGIATHQLVALRADSGDLLAIGRTLYPTGQLPEGADERVIEYVRVIQAEA
jgi:tRNA pseudouridine55 synthase